MATATGDSSSKESQGCPICLDAFTSPRQLPCLHSFCQNCLQDYITKKANATMETFEAFLCPLCRTITRPERNDKPVGEWASVFPKSPISMIESKVKVEQLCDICSSRKSSNIATTVCIVCEEAMCDDCSFAHQTMKISRNHKVLKVEELGINPQFRITFSKTFGCPAHQEKKIEFYCKSHEAACCGTCSFLHHKACKEVLELETNIADLLKETKSQTIMQELVMLEGYLTKLTEMNETNIGILESQLNDITVQICEIRKKINSMLDDLEKRIKDEGDRIYKEEMIRKQEQNHQCQSLINAIRNSYALLESVSRLGTDTQKFLVTRQTMKHLVSYREQIQEKFEKVDSIKLMLHLDSDLQSVLSQGEKELMKVVSKEETEILQTKCNIRPLQEHTVKLSKVIHLDCPKDQNPLYTGVALLRNGEMVLTNFSNNTCCLYDISYKLINMYTLPNRPYDMCLIDDNEVAVTIPFMKTVQFLSIKDHSINNTGTLATRYKFYGVAAVSKEEIVVSGNFGVNTSNKCYWSLISKDGKEKFHHEFDCKSFDSKSVSQAFIALNTSKSCVYVCVGNAHAVYCFRLADGKQCFVYTANDLKTPRGVAVDRDDNVYVVGSDSQNIHKLSSDGVILQVITSGVPILPIRISFCVNLEHFFLTNEGEERKTLHYFIHK